MILNDGSGLDLPEIPGRAYFKHGKQVEVQTMLINPKKVLDLIPKNERVIIFDSSNEQPQKMLAPRQRNSSTNRRKEIPEHGTGRIFDF